MVKLEKEQAEALLGKCFAKEENGVIRFIYVDGVQIIGKDEAYVDGVFCMLNEKYDSWHATNINSLDQDTMKHWKEVGYIEISIEEFANYMDKLTSNMQKLVEDVKASEERNAIIHHDMGLALGLRGDDSHKDK